MSILHHHLTLDQLRDNEPDTPLDTLADLISILTTILLVAPKHGAAASRRRCSAGSAALSAVERVPPASSSNIAGHPEERSDEGSLPSSSTTPAPKPPSPILTGSGARALCKLASLADQWCHLILEGCRSKQVTSTPSYDSPHNITLPPTDPALLAPWRHAMHRAIRARIHEHFLEATRLAETEHRPINDADNRLVSLMLRIDPPHHALAKLHSPEAKRQAQRHAIEQARALERNTPRPNSSLPTSPVIPTGARVREREVEGTGSSTTPSMPLNRSPRPPSPAPSKSSPKPPQHPNPSKQYKLRKPKPAPITAAA